MNDMYGPHTGYTDCSPQVDRLHIKHAMGEEYLEVAELEEGRVTIAVEDRVEGRLHYMLADTWSPWGSSDSPVGSLVIIILPIMFGGEYLQYLLSTIYSVLGARLH